MKFFLPFLIAFILVSQAILAQQPCNEETAQPTRICSEAPIFCNLELYCSTMPGLASPQGASICNQGISLDNPHWISFIATSNSVTITIQPTNCYAVLGGLGLQGAIVTGCPPPPGGGPFQTVGNCQAQCTQGAFTLGFNGDFVIGQQYWIMLDGCSGSICDYQIVSTEGIAVPFFENPTFITGTDITCSGSTATYTVDDIIMATTYHWSVKGIEVTSSGPELHYTIPEGTPDGIYSVCLLDAVNACYGLVADNSYQSGSLCFEFEVNNISFEISGQPNICGTDSAYITVDSEFASIHWTGPEGFTSNHPNINTLTEGNYYITATDSRGCTATDSILVVKKPLPPISYVGSTTFCKDGQARIDIVEDGYLQYQWSDFQSGRTAYFDAEGENTIRVLDSFLCNNSLEIAIQESDTLTPLVAGTTHFCAGHYAELYAGPAYTTYEWNGHKGEEYQKVFQAGELVLHVQDQFGCEGSVSMFIEELAQPYIDQVIILDDTGESDGAIMVRFDRFKGSNYTMEWSNGANSSKITNLEAGEYTLTVTHPNGCQAVFTFEVLLNENFNFRIRDLDKLISDYESPKMQFNIFPNPFTEMTTIQFESLDIQQVHIYVHDVHGRLLIHQQQEIEKGIQFFHIRQSELPIPGIYFCTLNSNGYRVTKQIVYRQ